MKKYLSILLCVCVVCSMAVIAQAAEDVPYDVTLEYIVRFGGPPVAEDYPTDAAYRAAYEEWKAAVSAYALNRAAYSDMEQSAVRESQEESARQEAQQAAPVETVPMKPTESTGAKDGNNNQSVEDNSSAKYPIGSYVDSAGIVWSPDGTRLSPASALAESPAENAGLSSSDLGDPAGLPAAEDSDTLAVIAGLVSDIAEDQPVWYVEDLRPSESPVEVLTGLKSLVTSIFGEYRPVTTTSIVTETVGNDTHQYFVETVAPGAAGVDYEWLAGVFLFGILLFCLMKLLGGVLK